MDARVHTAEKWRFLRPLFVLLASGLVSLPYAQEDPPGVRWYLTGEEMDLVDVLNACATGLGVTVDYDRSQVQGKVTIQAEDGLSPEDFWTQTNRLLVSRKLASIHAPGEESIAIVPIDQAAKLARIESDPAAALAGFVKTLRNLHHAEPEKAAEVVKQILSAEGSQVMALPASRQILLAGLKPQVVEALSVLALLDTAAPPAVEAIPLSYSTPAAMASLLERVDKAIGQVSRRAPEGVAIADAGTSSILVIAPEPELLWWREQIARFDRPQRAVTRNYSPQRFSVHETAKLVEEVARPAEAGAWRMVEDELTGTLVVTATPQQHEAVEAVFRRLESAGPETRTAVRAFPVRHRDVDEFLTLLEELLQRSPLPQAPAGEGAPVATSIPEARTGGRPEEGESDLALAKDPQTNRILAIGPPRLLDQLGRLIEDLDVQHPQVLVEAMIVTLSDTQTRNLAVELQKIGVWNGSVGSVASLFGADSPDPLAGPLPAPSGTGFSAVVLDPGSFSGVLRALETVNHGRTLNVPKVLVNNNQTASLGSVLQTPYLTSNTSTNLATVSFGGTLDAGTSVQVTPQITDGDQLLLEYEISLSTFVGEAADPSLPPPRQENKLSSVATVPDGYTVVVGGLEVETDTDGVTRVPVLGSIPIIGALFRSQSRTKTRSRFFVFLRCSVMRSATYEELRYVSAPVMATAGLEDDLPVVEPRVIR